MPFSKKMVWVFAGLMIIILLIMLVSLFQRDKIEFTNLEIEAESIPKLSNDDPIIGNKSPSILIYHFGDFSNSSSTALAKTLNKIVDEYADEIAVVWKDYPNTSIEPESLNAAIAARCAQKQNSFWEYHDFLIQYSDILSQDLYFEIASELDLWQWSFERCFEKQKTLSWVEESYAQGLDLSVTAAPTLFINNERYSGYLTESELRSIINSLLSL